MDRTSPRQIPVYILMPLANEYPGILLLIDDDDGDDDDDDDDGDDEIDDDDDDDGGGGGGGGGGGDDDDTPMTDVQEMLESGKKLITFVKLHAPWDVCCVHAEDLCLRAPLQVGA